MFNSLKGRECNISKNSYMNVHHYLDRFIFDNGYTHMESLKGHYNSVNSVAFSPDGKLMASGGDDGRVIIWSVPLSIVQAPNYKTFYRQMLNEDMVFTNELVKMPLDNDPLDFLENMGMRSVFDVKFTLDSTHLVASGSDGHVKYIDLNYSSAQSNRQLATVVSNFHTHSHNVYQVSTHYENKHVFLTASADRTVQLCDVRDATHKFPKLRNTVGYNAVKYHPIFSYYFATADEDGTVALHDERKMSSNSFLSLGDLNNNMSSLVCKFESIAPPPPSLAHLMAVKGKRKTRADHINEANANLYDDDSQLEARLFSQANVSASSSASSSSVVHISNTPGAAKQALLLSIVPDIPENVAPHAIATLQAKLQETHNNLAKEQGTDNNMFIDTEETLEDASQEDYNDNGNSSDQIETVEDVNERSADALSDLSVQNDNEYENEPEVATMNRQLITVIRNSAYINDHYSLANQQATNHAALDICFDKQGTRLAAVFNRGPVKVWDFTNPSTPIAVCTDPTYMNGTTAKSICFTGTREEFVVSGGDNWKVFMWDVKNFVGRGNGIYRVRKAKHRLTGHNCNVKGVASHPTLPLMVSYGVEKQIKIWTALNKNKSEVIVRRPIAVHDKDQEVVYKNDGVIATSNNTEDDNDAEPANSTDESTSTLHFYDYLTLLEKTATNVTMFEQETNDLNDDQMEGVIGLYDAIEGISDDEAATAVSSGPSRNYLTT